ncbi:MAG TPA: MMPL family transporter [Candidatus Binatia bacterium]
MKIFAIRAGFLLFLAALVAFSLTRLDFSTDITNFMPDGSDADLGLLARHLARSDLARTMMLTVGSPSGAVGEERIAQAVVDLQKSLASDPEVAWVRSGPQDSDYEQIWKVYFPHRFGLFSLDPEKEIPAMTTPEAIAKDAEKARQALASPAAALVKRTLPDDPLGISQQILDRLQDDSPMLSVRHGVFFSHDGWGVLLLSSKASAFDAKRQEPLLAGIDARFAEIRAKDGGDLALEKSGANRFAVDAQRSMLGDMWWIMATSMLGISAIVLVYFRSAGRFLITLLPSLGGIIVATALGIVVFGNLDGLTLAFGASLIGVAIDYPIYLLNHVMVIGGRRRDIVRRVAPSLSMGALTTVAGFAGMSLTSFPGFREIGFFAAVGIASALAITLGVVPWFLDEESRPVRPSGLTSRALDSAMRWSLRRRRGLIVIPIAVAALGAVVMPRLQWQDDLSRLGNIDPRLEAEERRVHERVAGWEMGRVVLVSADSEQLALERTEALARRMQALKSSGAIGGFRAATSLVRSSSLQQRNIDALRAVPDLAQRVRQGFEAAGFRGDALAPFAADLASAPPPLAPDEFRGTALETMLEPLLLRMDDRWATITQISDPRDENAIRDAVGPIAGAHYFIQKDFVNDLYAQYRDSTFRQLLVGGLLIVGTLILRYRRLRPTLAACLPSVLVPILVLSGLSLAGQQINLLHIVSLSMVTGMGTDYGIFLVDSAGNKTWFDSTLVSLLLCWLTTVFGFAVIAISSHPALRAMGVTIGAGVTLSLLLSPVCLLVMGREVAPELAQQAAAGAEEVLP